MTCDPTTLPDAAKCFQSCIPTGFETSVQTYLLAQISASLSGTPTDPKSLLAAATAQGSSFLVTEGMQQEIMAYLLSLIAGGSTDPTTLANSAKCYQGCIPAGMEPAVVSYLLAQLAGGSTDPTVLMKAASPFLVLDGVQQEVQEYLLCNIAQALGITLPAGPPYFPPVPGYTPPPIPPYGGGGGGGGGGGPSDPVVANDWASRVVTNGGASPSANTVSAVSSFVGTLESAGIWSKMIAVNCFVPDNLTAAITPLLKGPGLDPWSNQGPFVAGDLTVNGLIGNASSKYLNTGIPQTAAFTASSCGMSLYYATTDNADGWEMGVDAGGGNWSLLILYTTGANAYFYAYGLNGAGNDYITANPSTGWTGFLSGSRTSTTAMAFYRANSGIGFTTLGSIVAGTAVSAPTVASQIYVFGTNNSNVVTHPSGKRLSFAAIHNGLTSSETQTLYNAVQALRVALGGGYV